jgi:imidazolonepropionase-like amidohydrolase
MSAAEEIDNGQPAGSFKVRPAPDWNATGGEAKSEELLPKVHAAQDDAGRCAFELHGEEFAIGTCFNPVAQSHELRLALA